MTMRFLSDNEKRRLHEQARLDRQMHRGGLYKLEPKELANIPAEFLVEKMGLTCHLNASRQQDLFETLQESKHPSF